MNAYDIEAFAGMYIQHMPESLGHNITGFEPCEGDRSVTRYVDAFAQEMGRFVGLRRKWIGGEDGGYDDIVWERAMFIDDECRCEQGGDYRRWIEFVEGIDAYGSDTPWYEEHLDGSSMEMQQ